MEEEITKEHIDIIEEIDTNLVKKDKFNYLKFIITSLIKPYDTYKNNKNKLEDYKNVGIISCMLIIIFTLFRLIKNIIEEVRVRNYWNNEVVINWNNVLNVNFIKTIGLGLVFFICLLLIISGVYFLASLVIKKDIKYQNILSIASISIIPFCLSYLVLNPLFSVVHNAIGISALIFGICYSLIIIVILMNDLIKIEDKNKSIYFNMICISLIIILSLFLIYEIDLKILIEDIKIISNFLK